jgi:hypothetical protein
MLRCRDGHKAAMPRRDTLGTSLQDTVTRKYTERRLIQAYLKLFLAVQSEDGVKTVSLARFGSYEVRVIELSRDASAEDSKTFPYGSSFTSTIPAARSTAAAAPSSRKPSPPRMSSSRMHGNCVDQPGELKACQMA